MEQAENHQGETAFESPMPMLHFLKKLIFGESNPSVMQQVMISINLLIWVVFMVWHLLSYFAISYRDVILSEKKINVEILILNRGSALGFDPTIFLDQLLSFHRFGLLCWIGVFISISLMWRRKIYFVWVMAGSLFFYYSVMLMKLGTTYYLEDTTFFDKIAVALLVLNSLFYWISMRQDDADGMGLFGIKEED